MTSIFADSSGPPPLPATYMPRYFPVSRVKLICLSLSSFGLYEIYWFYKNWRLERERMRENLSPFWRSVFAVLFCYSLFKRILDTSAQEGLSRRGGAGLLTVVFVVASLCWKMPDPYWLAGFINVLPLVVVQETVAKINAKVSPDATMNKRFSGPNLVLLVLGGPLFIYVVLITLFPHLAPAGS